MVRVVDDRLAARGEVAAGREVHQRVGAVAAAPSAASRPRPSVLLATGEAPMLALILVVIMRPMPVGSRRFGARSPRSASGSSIAAPALRDGLVHPVGARRRARRDGRRPPPGTLRVAVRGRRVAAAAGEMAHVGRDHQAPARHLVADELGRRRTRARATRRISGVMMPASGRFELCRCSTCRFPPPV